MSKKSIFSSNGQIVEVRIEQLCLDYKPPSSELSTPQQGSGEAATSLSLGGPLPPPGGPHTPPGDTARYLHYGLTGG